jgi:glycosyltransferase involved in cell wall biosynthesis
MRIVLLKGQSRYGAQRLHVDQLSAALDAIGHVTAIADVSTNAGIVQLEAYASQGIDAVFAFNGVGSVFRIGEKSLFDLLKVPYVTLLVDHPVYHLERLSASMRNFVVATLDRSHGPFLRAYFEPEHFSMLSFMPPGANVLREPEPDTFEKHASRKIPVLFTGTYRGIPTRPWRTEVPPFFMKLFDDAADIAIAHDTMSVEQAVDEALRARNLDLSSHVRKRTLMLAYLVHDYMSAYRRDQLLRTLNDAQVPLTIYGAGWPDHMHLFPHFQYCGEGSFLETLELLHDTRIVLNSNNNFVAGGHERVFAAMMGGAAVVSDVSEFYLEAFQEGVELELFRWTKLNELGPRMHDLLADPTRTAAMAEAGYRAAEKQHSWTARARQVAALIEAATTLVKW